MKRHVLFTGEVGSGKSTALMRTLALLGVPARGIQTYTPQARDAAARSLYLRAWGDAAQGVFLAQVPGGDAAASAAVFDGQGCALLERARADGMLIVIDEIGRLERDAGAYQAALRACLDGDTPVVGVIRKGKSAWADWVRSHPAVTLIEVTRENRDDLPAQAAAILRGNLFSPGGA